MALEYHLLDVFTTAAFGGNPLAVVRGADRLSPDDMAAIARELNLSETVFVLRPRRTDCAHRMRIFTPGMELPFAGHPTVGTAVLLAALGEVPLADGGGRFMLEQEVGPVAVTVRDAREAGGTAQLSAAMLPARGPAAPPSEQVAALLRVEESALHAAPWAPEAWSAGVPFLLIPLRSIERLGQVQLDRSVWGEVLADAWAPHVYCFAPAADDWSVVRARMFSPAMDIDEDPATGAAAAALAGYLAARRDAHDGHDATLRWTVEQGVEMGRASRIELEADLRGGAVSAVRLGGAAVRIADGVLRLPG